jgi:hypothetical protein
MIDPSAAGPAEPEALKIFAALNSLAVIAVSPDISYAIGAERRTRPLSVI